MTGRFLPVAASCAVLAALAACSEPAQSSADPASGGSPTGGSAAGGAGPSGGVSGASGALGGLGGTAPTTGGTAPTTGGTGAGGSGGLDAGTGPGGVAGAAGSAGGAATGGFSGESAGGAGGIGAGSGGGGAGAGGTGGNGGTAGGGSGGKAGAGGGGGSGATANLTIWIAGDSTVATGGSACPIGWGGVFDPLFNDRVSVTNSAVGGRSVRTWLYNVQTTMDASGECELARDGSGNPTIQARWQAMLTGMKAGDYLFIQFGINDGSATCDRHVGLAAFKTSYGMMAQAAKDRGARPIFVTPVSSVACSGSTARGTRGAYVTATQEAGTQYGVPVLDLHALSVALYTARGFCPIPGGDVSASTTGPVGVFFCDDHTHFDRPGAVNIAGVVAQALRTQGIPLAAYLR